MSIAHTLVEIIKNSEEGIIIYCPDINQLCRDIFEETGTMFQPQRQLDYYGSGRYDRDGDEYMSKRINTRKFLIKNHIYG